MKTLDDIVVLKNHYREIESTVPNSRAFQQMGTGCNVIVSIDAGAWHLSIAHHMRYPLWEQIARARYDLLPADITMAMMLPPIHEYVNVHNNCFHLFEVEDDQGKCRVK